MKLFIILTLILFLHLPFSFLPSVSCGPSWSWVYYVVKDTLTFRFPCSHHAGVPCVCLSKLMHCLLDARQTLYQLNYIPGPFYLPCFPYWLVTPTLLPGLAWNLWVQMVSFPRPQSAPEVRARHCVQLNALLLFNMHGLYSSLSFFVLIIILFLCSWSIFLELYRFY